MIALKESNVKQHILNVAMELFYEKGYDNTSINAIIENVGVSKGAFYHYFKSKEDVLEAVAGRHIEVEITITKKAAEERYLNALEKINKVFNEVLTHKVLDMGERQKISKFFESEGNVKFQRKVVENKIKLLTPLYLSIIKQGIMEGIFKTSYPDEVAEQIIQMLIILNSMVVKLTSDINEKPENIAVIKRKIEAYREAVERILGAPKDSINFLENIRIFEEYMNNKK
ncbi:TetR/AcrR family transcriptional regulator [Sedimentibacter sp.]|uniref:TetR/AcrR family transcriptional regulator n=2 Tax=Sedimentibacter sp. TaxID=1960295 RepID=UPI0028A5943B|nr:TetR/AcrR family transcriptional regulator [Sedimentibacter sp.]